MIKAKVGNSAMYIASLKALERAASMEAALYDGDQEISYKEAEQMLNSQTQTMSASEALKTMSAFLNGGGSGAAMGTAPKSVFNPDGSYKTGIDLLDHVLIKTRPSGARVAFLEVNQGEVYEVGYDLSATNSYANWILATAEEGGGQLALYRVESTEFVRTISIDEPGHNWLRVYFYHNRYDLSDDVWKGRGLYIKRIS